jgi:uncharacterized membrane protein
MIVLSYLGILCLIPLLTKKDDPDVQWHAKNGLCLMLADIAVCIIFGVIGAVGAHIPVAGCGIAAVMAAIWCILPIAILVVHVIAMIKAINGQRFRIPFVSDFADKM